MGVKLYFFLFISLISTYIFNLNIVAMLVLSAAATYLLSSLIDDEEEDFI